MKRVPRYTSYPTALQFCSEVRESEYLGWLFALESKDTLSLYVHIPFCEQLCWFCGCSTKVTNSYKAVENYLVVLVQELSLVAKYVRHLTVKHIHFGGGSPSILTVDDFDDLIGKLHQLFLIDTDVQIDIEVDPRNMSLDKARAYVNSGVTRASLGVQDFDYKVQKAINRVQSYDMVKQVVDDLRCEGVKELNIDLIYGLPFQELGTIEDTIECALSLKPNRISLFGYAHVPWLKKHQSLILEDVLPGEEERGIMCERAGYLLEQAGYVAIGLDHFALPDDPMVVAVRERRLQRNFQGYSVDEGSVLLGVGASSISSLPQGYVQNESNVADYMKMVGDGVLPVCRGVALTEDDYNRREIIMSLMRYLQARVVFECYPTEMHQMQQYIDAGDVVYEGDVLTVLPVARKRLRMIAAVFDAYYSNSELQYSQAI